MMSARDPTAMTAAARLDEVARLLAEAILRARHRRLLKRNLATGTREDSLEVCATSRTHVTRNGDQ